MVYVEAVYQLDNRGAEKQLHLLFASGSERVSDFQVWLGEQKVPTTPAEGVEVAASWKPPPKTPGIHGGYYLDYGHVAKRPLTPLACTIVLPPGQQSLKVRYQAEASKYPSDLAAYWQFAYVLAPARDWSRFGGVDVTIHLPDGWYAAATPPLTREGEVLHGSFPNIPPMPSRWHIQAPVSWIYRPIRYLGLGLLALSTLGGAVLCFRVGRWSGRHHAPSWLATILVAIGQSAIWGMAVYFTGMVAVFGPSLAIPAHQMTFNRGLDLGGIMLFLGVIILTTAVVVAGFVITRISLHTRRKALPVQ